MERPKYSGYFLTITAVFVTCLLVSNIIAGKLIQVADLVLPAGAILFPITYILGDVCTEVYGFARSRLMIWLGFGASALMSLAFMATVALPFPPFFQDQAAYATVLGMAPRLVIASLLAYLVGEFVNSLTLSLMKRATKGRLLWTRTIGSTILGQAVDTVLFISLAFWGERPAEVLIQLMLAQYLVKVGYETLFTPLTYVVVNLVKKREGVDAFDGQGAYKIFGGGKSA